MNQTPGRPPYPPERNVWQYPPPPIERRWLWVAILAVVSSLVAAVGLAVTAGFVASKDFPSLIENHTLLTVIDRECSAMTASVRKTPVDGTPKHQVAILADQNRAVEMMVQDIRMVDPAIRNADKPTDEWLADWGRLIDARESYAALVLGGNKPNLRIPRDGDGDRIHLRMNHVWLESRVCSVPSELLNPYPEDLADA